MDVYQQFDDRRLCAQKGWLNLSDPTQIGGTVEEVQVGTGLCLARCARQGIDGLQRGSFLEGVVADSTACCPSSIWHYQQRAAHPR
jgi:hypothetical protein